MMRCPYCRAPIAVSESHESGLRIEYGPGGLVIYDCSSPIHSCDLERAQRADRQAS
jgi:hypothetical protein